MHGKFNCKTVTFDRTQHGIYLGLPLPRPQIRFAHLSFVSCQYRSEHGNANERGLMSLRQGEMGENTPFTCKVSKKSINDVDHNRVTTLEFK